MKLYQLLLCCATILGGKADSPDPHLWVEIENMYTQLTNIVNTAIQTVLRQTRSLSSDLIILSQTVSTEAQNQIRTGTNTIKDQLLNLEILATALDRNICLKGAHYQMDYVVEHLIADTRLCIYEKTSEGIGVINNISLTIKNADLRLDKIREDIKACVLDDNDDCIYVLRAEIQLSIDELPTAILDETLEVLLLSREWTIAINNCADHRVGLVYTGGNRKPVLLSLTFRLLPKCIAIE